MNEKENLIKENLIKENLIGNVHMVPVQSSNIAAIGYQSDLSGKTGHLFVKFASGQTYRYDDVPGEEWTRLLGASSKGQHLARHIRGAYPYAKV